MRGYRKYFSSKRNIIRNYSIQFPMARIAWLGTFCHKGMLIFLKLTNSDKPWLHSVNTVSFDPYELSFFSRPFKIFKKYVSTFVRKLCV
jgi:hypothetical protein